MGFFFVYIYIKKKSRRIGLIIEVYIHCQVVDSGTQYVEDKRFGR